MKYRIIGIVSLYNPRLEYCKNLKTLKEMVDLLVIIDDSPQCCKKIVKTIFDRKTLYLWNGENIGLSRSLNKGIEIAIKNKADWILFMDQDSFPQSTMIKLYQDCIISKGNIKIALLAPQYNYDRHRRAANNAQKEIKVTNLSGCLVNIDVIKKVGAFDERFYIDGLDFEWCLRARRQGYKIIRVNSVVINHNPAVTRSMKLFPGIIIKYGWDTYIRYYYQFRSSFLIHSMYSDYFDFYFIAKLFKICVFFNDKSKYLKSLRKARTDFKNGYFGRYEEV